MNDVTATTEAAPAKAAKAAPKKPAASKAAAKKAAEARAKKMSAVKKTAKPKKEKVAKEPSLGSYPLGTKLGYGSDAEGKKYGPKNSPKRDGTAAGKMWAKYALPGTIQKQLDAGVKRSAILWDLKHGYVVKA
jgi:hypothetical protein